MSLRSDGNHGILFLSTMELHYQRACCARAKYALFQVRSRACFAGLCERCQSHYGCSLCSSGSSFFSCRNPSSSVQVCAPLPCLLLPGECLVPRLTSATIDISNVTHYLSLLTAMYLRLLADSPSKNAIHAFKILSAAVAGGIHSRDRVV